MVTITNTGNNPITSCTINYQVDAQAPLNTTFNGSIAPGATGTVSIPAITATAGSHTLTVSTSAPNGGSDVNPNNDTKKTTFTIIGTAINTPIVEPFTSTTYPPANWTRIDLDGDAIGWSRIAAAGSSSGGGASRIYFYNSPPGNIDELYLPYNNLGGSAQITFYVAGAPYTASTPENDKLELMVSTDCGQNWSTVYSKSGTTLYTNAAVTSNFAPASAGQWRMETVPLTAYNNTNNILMKFVGTSDYGNNVFVDDVNLTSTVGINTQPANVAFSTVYPNPAQASATVLVNLVSAENVKVSVLNVLGAVVSAETKAMTAGDNHVSLTTSALANGLYNVVIATEKGNIIHKLTVNN